MKSGDSSVNAPKGVGPQVQSFDFVDGHNLGADLVSNDVKGKENLIHSQNQESMDLYSRASAQEKEIMYLKEQITLASFKESQLLNEKHTLERIFSELRMALHEKQNEIINSQANELARRRGDLEVNLHLINELKDVDDDRNIFTSSMLAILAEYGVWPHVVNASALSSSIKHLHDELEMKITTSDARLAELNSMIVNNARNSFLDKATPSFSNTNDELPSSYMGVGRFSMNSNHHIIGKHLETADDAPRYVQENAPKQGKNSTRGDDKHHLPNNEGLLRTLPDNNRNMGGQTVDGIWFHSRSEQSNADQVSHPSVMHDGIGSFGTTMLDRVDSFGNEEECPGIEGFQIIGEAKLGCNLLGCGYPVRGTSLCMFQWLRHYPDGTSQYIEGATNPDYVMTADDVDAFVAVECIPMDQQGRQGDLVTVFANDNNKITCDEEMQEEIDGYISQGLATFKVLILSDDSENWEAATLILRRSGFQVEVDKKLDAIISENYSKDLLVSYCLFPGQEVCI